MKNKKGKNIIIVSSLLLSVLIAGCSGINNNINEGNKENRINETSDDNVTQYGKALDKAMTEVINGDNLSIVYDSDDRNIDIGIDKNPFHINLEGEHITLSDNSIGKITGSKLIIQKPGTYVIRGTLNDGQIVVNSKENGIVHLIFDDVSITSKKSAPLYIINATKTVLTLKENTHNYLIDSDAFEYDNATEEEPNATLYSKSNLTINGSGNLSVTANFKHGIAGKKEFKIIGSNIKVKAKDSGIIGRDYIAIESGIISVEAGGDGLKSTNNMDPSFGHVVIDGGTINIKASHEGIQAETIMKVNNGKVNIKSKGDGIYALSSVYVHDGKLDITSGIDGIQGDKSVYITGGVMNITTGGGSTFSGKGLKAKEEIDVLGGTVIIDSTGTAIYAEQIVNIYGGTIHIQSSADNIHAGESLTLKGGDLIAVGSSAMVATSSTDTSSQYSVYINYETTQKANTLFHIEDVDGNEIVTYAPTKDYQYILISSSSLKKGGIYNLYSGGSVTGEELESSNTNETYSGGSLVKSFKITSMVTQVLN